MHEGDALHDQTDGEVTERVDQPPHIPRGANPGKCEVGNERALLRLETHVAASLLALRGDCIEDPSGVIDAAYMTVALDARGKAPNPAT